MNYFQRGSLISIPAQRLSTGYVLLTLGILMAISGGTWDVTNHLLNKPETFFSPPHAILYSGAGMAVLGAMLVLSASRVAGKTEWPAKLALGGVALLMVAGPVDFWWHSLFGLDGLLSPPHAVLVSGMMISSIASMIGLIYAWPKLERSKRRTVPSVLVLLGMLPVWLASAGSLHMFSLPFSHTGFFNFDPQPQAGALLATLGFPLVTAAILTSTFSIANRRFGIVSALSSVFLLISVMTSIIPNESLWPTIPFYLSVLVPLVAVDAILSHWRSRGAIYAAGAIAGISFFMLYYPLITHTYNEILMPERAVWASLTAIIYFEMAPIVFPLVVAPAAAMGILGAIIGQKMAARAELALLK
jgi:hypothetical protein